jgi:dipeptidyl aminopeptidase/acylaminoacyl peptidase
LASGDDDTTVYPKNTFNLAAKLNAFGVPVTEYIYPNVGHIGIIVSLAYGFRSKTTLLEDITQFINHTNKR